MVRDFGAGELVTVADDGYPLSTFLPVIWEGERVIAHFARANPHWEQIAPHSPTLLVVGGPHAYISPTWYPSKEADGRVVPTWNYSSVHICGEAVIHDDEKWVREAVTKLTQLHEGGRDPSWRVTDAPLDFVSQRLGGIVGVEILIRSVEGKAKLSQNRPHSDQVSVIAALKGEGSRGVAEAMDRRQ